MKHLKKRFSAFLCLVLAAALLAGCSGASSEPASSQDAASQDASSAPDAPDAAAAFDYSCAMTDEGWWKDVDALSLVTLGEYKGIEVPAEVASADPALVEEQIGQILQSYATYEHLTDKAIEEGDTVNIDYVGSVDGVEFTGGNTQGMGTDVTIGVTNYIDDFLEQLIGHKPGEVVDVYATFPDGYDDGQDAQGNTVVLQNKEALFVVTINYIEGDVPILPEFDDAFVAENLSFYGYSTAAEVREDIAASIVADQESEFFTNWIMENCPVSEVPESMIQYWKDATAADVAATAASYGMDAEMILAFQGFESMEAYMEAIHESVVTQCKQCLISQAIVQTEGLSITEEEELEILGANHDAILAEYGQGYVRMTLLVGEAFDLVSGSAVRP